MSTAATESRNPVITDEDLAALDTQSVLDEPLHATDRVNEVFLKFGSWLVVGLTIVMTIIMTLAVVMRYAFNSSLPIASEGPTYLFPWLIAGGAIVAQAQMAHVGVNYFLEKFKGKAFEYVSIGIWVFIAILMAYMTYLGLYMAGPMAAQETLIMGWPRLGSFGAFIVMTACLSIQAAARAWFFHKTGAIRESEPGTDIPTEEHTKEIYGV